VRDEGTVPCNNDLLAENFIWTGERFQLIDYEYSGNNDPMFELGNVWSESNLSLEQLEELVLPLARASAIEPAMDYGATSRGVDSLLLRRAQKEQQLETITAQRTAEGLRDQCADAEAEGNQSGHERDERSGGIEHVAHRNAADCHHGQHRCPEQQTHDRTTGDVQQAAAPLSRWRLPTLRKDQHSPAVQKIDAMPMEAQPFAIAREPPRTEENALELPPPDEATDCMTDFMQEDRAGADQDEADEQRDHVDEPLGMVRHRASPER